MSREEGAGVKKPTTQRMSRQMFLKQSPNRDPHSCQEKKRAKREERSNEKSKGKKQSEEGKESRWSSDTRFWHETECETREREERIALRFQENDCIFCCIIRIQETAGVIHFYLRLETPNSLLVLLSLPSTTRREGGEGR